ncbi:N/A [soil metagenome]
MAVRQLDDAELIDNTRAGDADAFGELYRRHFQAARVAAQALTHNRVDSDDVISEAFARVLRASRSGGGPDVSFRPYLVAAVRNVFYDGLRCNRESPRDDVSDHSNIPVCDVVADGEGNAVARAALAALPERWQRVLWHTEVEGLSAAEIAPLLGLEPNGVAALAYRAREGLRQAYLRANC